MATDTILLRFTLDNPALPQRTEIVECRAPGERLGREQMAAYLLATRPGAVIVGIERRPG